MAFLPFLPFYLFTFKRYYLPRRRVTQCQHVGVEAETLRQVWRQRSTTSVEAVAHYRTVKTQLVGSVHAQLVCASCHGCEGDELPSVNDT